ncbi:MAG: LuxR C-terminal-related transcriptional regulator [Mycobacterium sp.]
MSGLVPIGTVTLLLADVEGSTRLWETEPEEMTSAFADLDRALAELVAAHGGVRPIEQGEGDSFVIAFGRASDAVACALDLQRASLGPIRLRIGVHTGEVQLRDEANYIGPTINRTARLRDLAHGGQTVLSGTTGDLVCDRLPVDAWLTELGTHPVRDLPRPERVVQLCHPGIRNEFPPLRTAQTVRSHNLPATLTSFVGRHAEIADVHRSLTKNRLVSLTGAGGAGKTRLAVEVAAQLVMGFEGGVWYIDLAPITDPAMVAVTVAHTLGLPDQPGRSPVDTLLRFISDRQLLLLLDNCEHLLDSCGELVVALLNGCAHLTILTTSREPIGVPGEVTWRVPSLSLTDEAIELFTDRAQRARPGFRVTGPDAGMVAEICRRLDGMPLAIELAAARVRTLSLAQIVESLNDRFRLLTGGARTAVRRQQTLRASVDWSHSLLTDSERTLFRRLAVFMAGFDLEGAQAVGASTELECYQLLDQLGLLVDKSLVVAEDVSGAMRYRLLETVRQYALEKLAESGEADVVRTRHCDHFESLAAWLNTPAQKGFNARLARADTELDNLRAAFAWCQENRDLEAAVGLASSLQPLWETRGRLREGLTWFSTILTNDGARDVNLAPAVWARALADKATLDALVSPYAGMAQAEQALEIARTFNDPALLARALSACCGNAAYQPGVAAPYLAEALSVARGLEDDWTLSQILFWQAIASWMIGEPIAVRAAAEEGRDLVAAIADRLGTRRFRFCLGVSQMMRGDLSDAAAQFGELVTEADTSHDVLGRIRALPFQARVLVYQGDTGAARAAAEAAVKDAWELGDYWEGVALAALAVATLAAGDVVAAASASELVGQRLSAHRTAALNLNPRAEIALARGDLVEGRRLADDAVSTTAGWHLVTALTARVRVAMAQGELERAGRDAYDALACAADTGSYQALPDVVECIAALAVDAGNHREAARMFGASQAMRERMGVVRFQIYQAAHEAAVLAVRGALAEQDFNAAWAEGAALSVEEAVAYIQRGRGERKRPSSGWESLTPTERDVVRLVSQGLSNKDIATRLFISPRTVQTHLTHVYNKLGLASRLKLVQEAARHI